MSVTPFLAYYDFFTDGVNMLLSFRVENYRSFQDEQTLDLIASKRMGDTGGAPHCIPIPATDEAALRIAVLYGANGAGKSNLVRALRLVERLVFRGTSPGKRISYEPFLLDNEVRDKPSRFELQFMQEGRVFRYAFCCDAERIHDERLSVYEGKKERSVFSRVAADKGAAKVKLGAAPGKVGFPARLKALAEVGARPNQLFLKVDGVGQGCRGGCGSCARRPRRGGAVR